MRRLGEDGHPLRDLSFPGASPPMSPSQDQSTRHRNQPPENRPQRRQAARPPRSRECLLKGCGKRFRPRYPMGALLQRGLPARGPEVVAMEKPATVAEVGERAEEAEATKRPTSRTAAAGRTCVIRA